MGCGSVRVVHSPRVPPTRCNQSRRVAPPRPTAQCGKPGSSQMCDAKFNNNPFPMVPANGRCPPLLFRDTRNKFTPPPPFLRPTTINFENGCPNNAAIRCPPNVSVTNTPRRPTNKRPTNRQCAPVPGKQLRAHRAMLTSIA